MTDDKIISQIVEQQLEEIIQSSLRDFPDLIANTLHAVDVFFGAVYPCYKLHKGTNLGMVCLTHTIKAANDFFAGYYLAQRGMYTQAANQIRSGLETASQGSWLHIKRDKAKDWWDGKRVAQPWKIRSELSNTNVRDHLYKNLSELAHPNRRSVNSLMTKGIDPEFGVGLGLAALYDDRATADIFATLHQCVSLSLLDFSLLHEPPMNADELKFWRKCVAPIFKYHDEQLPLEMQKYTKGL